MFITYARRTLEPRTALSLISLVRFYGNAFILLGRLLCIAWTIAVGIALVLANRQKIEQEAIIGA
jgi:hypothetical protein